MAQTSKDEMVQAVRRLQLGIKLHEPINTHLLKAFLAEFLGMTLFIFITISTIANGCKTADVGVSASSGSTSATGATGTTSISGAVVQPVSCQLNTPRVLTIAASFGFSIFVFVFATAPFSGGNLNPAITLGYMISSKVTLVRAIGYWTAQITGAILGAAFARAVDIAAFKASLGGTNALALGVRPAGAWLMESVLTFALVYMVFTGTDSARARSTTHLSILAPLAIGMVVFVSHLVAIPIDGCSINPARSLGPAIVAGRYQNMWIFWVGPFTGALMAAMVYELGFRPSWNTGRTSPGNDLENPEAKDHSGAPTRSRNARQADGHESNGADITQVL